MCIYGPFRLQCFQVGLKQMFNRLKSWAQSHIVASMLSVLTVGVGTGATTVWKIYGDQVNRLEDMKVAEFNQLTQEIRTFNETLNVFTSELATTGQADQAKKMQLSTSLVRLYGGLTAFSVNIPTEKEETIKSLKTSINEVKKHVQATNSKDDLDPLSVALVDLYRNLKRARPIIEHAVGKEFLISS